MKSSMIAAALLVGVSGAAFAAEKVTIYAINSLGIGQPIGEVSLADGKAGLEVTPQLNGLPPGDHGFHVHVNPSCGPLPTLNAPPAAGMQAGGHFDPGGRGKHLGPTGDGHKGDLPALKVATDGTATAPVTAPNLKLADVLGRSLMIHAGGDNFSDEPAPLGGGGPRIACGLIPATQSASK